MNSSPSAGGRFIISPGLFAQMVVWPTIVCPASGVTQGRNYQMECTGQGEFSPQSNILRYNHSFFHNGSEACAVPNQSGLAIVSSAHLAWSKRQFPFCVSDGSDVISVDG